MAVSSNEITFVFDSNINSVSCIDARGNNFTWSVSGQNYSISQSGDQKFIIQFNEGYILNTVVNTEGFFYIKDIADTDFTAEIDGYIGTVTLTSKLSPPRKSVDLTTLAGWSALPDKTYNITIVAKANGYRDSNPSAAVSVEKASTGYNINIITSQTYKEFPKENHYFKINGVASPTNWDGYIDSNGALHGISSFTNARTISSYVESGMGNRMIVNGIIYSRYGDTGSIFYEEGTEIEITSNQDITIYYYFD